MPTKFIREKLAVVAVDTRADRKLKQRVKATTSSSTPMSIRPEEDFVFGHISFYLEDNPRSRRFFQY